MTGLMPDHTHPAPINAEKIGVLQRIRLGLAHLQGTQYTSTPHVCASKETICPAALLAGRGARKKFRDWH